METIFLLLFFPSKSEVLSMVNAFLLHPCGLLPACGALSSSVSIYTTTSAPAENVTGSWGIDPDNFDLNLIDKMRWEIKIWGMTVEIFKKPVHDYKKGLIVVMLINIFSLLFFDIFWHFFSNIFFLISLEKQTYWLNKNIYKSMTCGDVYVSVWEHVSECLV